MIDVTRPVPCLRFISQPFSDQLAHIGSEVSEVSIAYGNYVAAPYIGDAAGQAKEKEHLAEELTDVITAATTALAMLGYDEEARIEMQRRVNEKNRVRGYWEAD